METEISGICMINGVDYSSNSNKNAHIYKDALFYRNNNTYRMKPFVSESDFNNGKTNKQWMLSSPDGYHLVVDGAVGNNPKANYMGSQYSQTQRTMLGYTSNGNFVVVCVTGAGITGAEGAKIMRDLGCANAIMLDGGGSTQMYVRGTGTIRDTGRAIPNVLVIKKRG